MIIQAIETKYLGPTNTRPGRIKAKAWAGSITVEWDHSLSVEKNHESAASALRQKLGWVPSAGRPFDCTWAQGGATDGSGYVFVAVERDA